MIKMDPDAFCLEMRCTDCGNDMSRPMGSLRRDPRLVCTACGHVEHVSREEMGWRQRDIERSLAQIDRAMSPH